LFRKPRPEEWDYSFAWGGHPFELGARWRPIPFRVPLLDNPHGGKLEVQSWVSLSNGVVLVVAKQFRAQLNWTDASGSLRSPGEYNGQGQFTEVLKRPDGRRLSTKLTTLGLREGNTGNLLVDGDDHTIWQIESEAGTLKLAQVSLPGNDRFIDLDARFPRRWALAHGASANCYSEVPIVVGERGRYYWDNDQFVVYEPSEEFVLRSKADALCRVQVELVDTDVLAPSVRVLDAATKAVMYEQRFTVEASRWSALAFASTLLRSPLTTTIAFTSAGPGQPLAGYFFSDPLLMGQSRPWLLAANLLLSAFVVAALMRRRVLGLRWSWIALLALAGPAVWFVPLLLEPLRAPRALKRKVLPTRQLVLQST
jgi:hypothetical protein